MICTFPGRFGDLLWALPTVRALSEQAGERVDLVIAGEFAGLIPLLERQPYLRQVCALKTWGMEDWRPAELPDAIHLGYKAWPDRALPYYIAEQAGVTIDLLRPWIRLYPSEHPLNVNPFNIAVGFTEAWFELKLGLLSSLTRQLKSYRLMQMTIRDSRWMAEGVWINAWEYDWIGAAQEILSSALFFGDCSALHVLAVALGKKVVIMEPMEGRWNPIFYPLGMDGPHVTVVKGNDGRPTFDARHCADTIRKVLRG